MERDITATGSRIKARNAGMRLLNRLTAGVAFAAVGGVAAFSVVSAHTMPESTATATSTSSTSTSTTASTSTSSSSSGLQSSSTPVNSSSSKPVAVFGGS